MGGRMSWRIYSIEFNDKEMNEWQNETVLFLWSYDEM